jgi:hypothetical protein
MQTDFTRVLVLATELSSCAVVLMAAACSSPTNGGSLPGPTGDGGALDGVAATADASNGSAEASDDGGPPGLTLVWQVVAPHPADAGSSDAGSPDGGTDPIAGALACVYQQPSIPCATTGANGVFTLRGLPTTSDVVVEVTHPGFRPVLRPIETASTPMDGTAFPISLRSNDADDSVLPVTLDWSGKGVVTFFAIAPLPDGGGVTFGGDPGATVGLTPDAGDGPYFFQDDGTFVASATALVGASGEYVNLDPGTYEITFADAVHDCAPISAPFGGYGFPVPPLSVRIPVVAGHITGPAGVFCTDKSPVVDAGR